MASGQVVLLAGGLQCAWGLQRSPRNMHGLKRTLPTPSRQDNSPEDRSLQCFRSSIRELGRAGRTTLAIGTGKQHVPWSHGPRRSRPSPELQLRGVCTLGRSRLRGFVERWAALGVWG